MKTIVLAALALLAACSSGPKPLPMPQGEVFHMNPGRATVAR